ncbi:MAG: hypothetical protein IPO90_03960 [Flavobacteriales bacterium]|nr:hypothetical protein [Flavobacteriales bacterium]
MASTCAVVLTGLLRVDECHLQPEPSNSVRNFIRAFAGKQEPNFYDIRKHEGWLRTVMVRTTTTGECMVLIAFGQDHPEAQKELLGAVKAELPNITSLLWTVESKDDTRLRCGIKTLPRQGDHIVGVVNDEGHPRT